MKKDDIKRAIEYLEAYLHGHECSDPTSLVMLISRLKTEVTEK